MSRTRTLALAVVSFWLAAAAGLFAELTVIGTTPEARALNARRGAAIEIEFDRPVDRSSVTPQSFWAFGRWSGTVAGERGFDDGDRVVSLTPARPLSAGEQVMVILSNELLAADGTAMRPAGYSFQFWTRSRGSGFDFVEIDRFTTRSSAAVTSRAYGGFGSDLDGDGALDLTIVNEDTNDLRTFLNRDDGSGRFFDFLVPTTPVGNVPSPSEPSDFDRDGNVDVAVANTQDQTVSILLGNGDGTFGPAQHVRVGGEPRGIAVLDADGDGDVDIAATSFADGATTVVFNDGDGRFNAVRGFGVDGDTGVRALAAGDMNGDGILDLVVGALISQEVQVWLGDGGGGYDLGGRFPSGGETWMLVLGDLDGDANEDVVVVNSNSDNGAVLMGDGAGGLGAARIAGTDPFPLATDLADLDGDGDLDWVTSSFFGDWMVFENDGSGSFTLLESYAAPQAASCSIPMDINGDGALDLVLIDELEDEVVLMASRSSGFNSDFESGDASDWSRSRGAVAVVEPGLAGTGFALEVTAAGTRRASFVESKHPAEESSWQVSFELAAGGVDLAGGELEILRLSGRKRQAHLLLRETSGQLRAHLFARQVGGFREVGSVSVARTGSVRLGVEWQSASGEAGADGRAALTKNGRTRAEARDLDNPGRAIRKVRMGLPGGSVDSAPGRLLFDEYVSSP